GLRQMAARASRSRALVLVIEDTHWVDRASLGLASLADGLDSLPILIILTHRPGFEPPWAERSNVTRITLPALSKPDSQALLDSVLAVDRVPASLPPLIIDRAEGNPFFLQELGREIVEVGARLAMLQEPASL